MYYINDVILLISTNDTSFESNNNQDVRKLILIMQFLKIDFINYLQLNFIHLFL